ncbi:MAG: tRNA-dihydrouridine synthase, partial [Clostridia bacterium]|nr:tRNA-dihydrouridine synthase [Clostridia bacterium]
VTAKFRIGFEEGHNVAVEVAKICERNGIKAITVHGRTREQMYSGKVDYETIKKVKQSVSIPVIGNGDVFDKESYQKMLDTGVDGVMIARGALGRPWIFAELKNLPTPNKMEIIKKHIEVLRKYYSESWICTNIRKHLLWYAQGVEGAAKIRLKLATTTNLDEALSLLEGILG